MNASNFIQGCIASQIAYTFEFNELFFSCFDELNLLNAGGLAITLNAARTLFSASMNIYFIAAIAFTFYHSISNCYTDWGNE